MSLELFDAHLHLHDPPLQAALAREGIAPDGGDQVVRVSNGTHPKDWPLVASIAGGPVLTAYGVHPWRVEGLPPDWEKQLREYLNKGAVSVGEIGLDNWIEPRDEGLQREVFLRQLQIARDHDLPPTLHCLRAWGMLLDCLRSAPDQPRGFLVHGFGGSRETLFELLDLGGYVSFSAYAADPGRKKMRDAARACPVDRILVETDAPDMVPPESACRHSFTDESGQRLHHPAEIRTAYEFLAEWRGTPLEDFTIQVGANFRKLFASGF